VSPEDTGELGAQIVRNALAAFQRQVDAGGLAVPGQEHRFVTAQELCQTLAKLSNARNPHRFPSSSLLGA
jgi:hypothetical protein